MHSRINFFLLYFNTVRFLKCKQIYYRIYYGIKQKLGIGIYKHKENLKYTIKPLIFQASIYSKPSYFKEGFFSFLNIQKNYSDIDWNDMSEGKLWCYNLNYFDFLDSPDVSPEKGLALINDFVDKLHTKSIGIEAYPISIRGINWIKFFSNNMICPDKKILDSLISQYDYLFFNIEFHILGNHLLENAFSLLFAAVFFHNKRYYKKANLILRKELNKQVLSDGAHFELSPMYHQIVLFRILEAINLLKNNNSFDQGAFLETFLKLKAQLMLSWLNNITFKNGEVPMVNDCAKNIAPSTNEIIDYANRLQINTKTKILLKDSGYRMHKTDIYECFVDVASIGPRYLTAHSHADTLSFILNKNGLPFIVDTGTSTYSSGLIRQIERSTEAHNTLVYQGKNQSQVWGGFRVAKRAEITYLKENNEEIIATHNGYIVPHTRKFSFSEKKILIEDLFQNNYEKAFVFIHFHPCVVITDIAPQYCYTNFGKIVFEKGVNIEIQEYSFANGFNRTLKAFKLKIEMQNNLITTIEL